MSRYVPFEPPPYESLWGMNCSDQTGKYSVKHQQYKEPKPFDGTRDIDNYLIYFSKCMKLNQWDYETSGLELATSLEGKALDVFHMIPPEKSDDYYSLVKALLLRFDPPAKRASYARKLFDLSCENYDSVHDYSLALESLARKSYPETLIPEQMLIDLFIKGLPSACTQMQVTLKNPRSLDDAVTVAMICEQYELCPPSTTNPRMHRFRCHKCKLRGHFRQQCPLNLTDTYKNEEYSDFFTPDLPQKSDRAATEFSPKPWMNSAASPSQEIMHTPMSSDDETEPGSGCTISQPAAVASEGDKILADLGSWHFSDQPAISPRFASPPGDVPAYVPFADLRVPEMIEMTATSFEAIPVETSVPAAHDEGYESPLPD